MIQKLILHSFGKFSRQEFPFTGTTVFFGANESGKSTIFDGLMEGICVSDARNTHIRSLKERYGEERSVEIEAHPEIPAADPYEFINLCAIRAGQIDVTTKDGKSWVEKVKQGLFTGGVDPSVLVKNLKREIESSARGTLKKRRTEAEQKRSELQAELEELQRKRSAVLKDEARVRESGGAIEELENQIKEKETILSKYTVYLENQQNIRVLRERRRMLTALSRSDQLEKDMRELNQFARDESEELASLHEEIDRVERNIASKNVLYADYQRRLTVEKKRLDEQQTGLEKDRAVYRQAETFSERLRDSRFAPVSRRKAKWKPLLLIASAAAASAAVLLFFLLSSPVNIAVSAAVLIGSGLLLFFSRYHIEETNEEDVRGNIEKLKEEWRIKCPGSRELVGTMPESLRDELLRIVNDYEYKEQQADEINNTLRSLRSEIEAIEKEISELGGERKAAEEKLNAWLKEHGVSSVKEYSRKIQEYASLRENSERIAQDIKRFCEELNVKEKAELRSRCDADIRALERYDADEYESDAAVRAARIKADDLEQEIDGLQRSMNELRQRQAKQEGVLESSLGNLPEQILRLEEELGELRKTIQDLDYDIAAAKEAAELFQEITEDAGLGLEKLSGEVARLFAALTGREGDVSFPEFNMESVEAADAGGGARPLEHLSTGTKDAFMLAARLVLARKAGNEQKLLILDEPFHALDAGRIRRALELIDSFIKEAGWQLVLFTKDAFLRTAAEKQFSDCLVHEL